jgi:NodT family efflux transporter outer membrane factor (OMF) lipoprotein
MNSRYLTPFSRNSCLGVSRKHTCKRLTILSLVCCLSACTPTRVDDPNPIITPTQWQHAPSVTAQKTADLKSWWKGFNDPLLNTLIDRALAANHDLRIAASRVREANAMVTVTESALYPSLDLFGFGGRSKRIDQVIGVPSNQGIKLMTPTADIVSGGLLARWEIDLFGGRHLDAEAAYAQANGSQEALHAVQVSLLAQVATNYLELLGIQQRTGILQKNIELQDERLRALQVFYRTGLCNEADIARQETLLHGTKGTLPALVNAEKNLIHRLGMLLGEPPEKLENRLAVVRPLPGATPEIPRLLPSGLLAQRPDLRLAQTEVSAAAARLGSARADMFPKLVLLASGGFGSLAVGGFPSLAESVYTLGSGLSAPIFNAGRIEAQIAVADERLNQVAANYEKTFLLALEDVENAFVAHRSASDSFSRLTEAEASAEKAYRLVDALYSRGAGNYLAVLDAQHSQLTASDERAKAETAVSVAMVSLYRAFGGGWTIASLDSGIDKNSKP